MFYHSFKVNIFWIDAHRASTCLVELEGRPSLSTIRHVSQRTSHTWTVMNVILEMPMLNRHHTPSQLDGHESDVRITGVSDPRGGGGE